MLKNKVNDAEVYNSQSQKVLVKTATKLKNKYYKTRKVNFGSLSNGNKPIVKLFSILLNVLLVVFMSASIAICLSNICSKVRKTPPTIARFTFMQVVTPSMSAKIIEINGKSYKSGFKVGHKIVAHSVDTQSLKIGDCVVFYVVPQSYGLLFKNNKHLDLDKKETKYSNSTSFIFNFCSCSLR